MTEPHALAKTILTERGLTGGLDKLSGGMWQFYAQRGTKGAAAQIQGEPDEAILREAAGQLEAALT